MDILTVTHFFNGFLMIALPIVLGIVLVNRFKSSWKVWLIGAAIFIISQVIHIPFNTYLLNPVIGSIQQSLLGAPGRLVGAVLLGLSAGVFEEGARYGMFRWWLQDKRSWRTALLAGAGHGGAEAILFGALALWVFLNLVAVRHADLSKLNLSPDQLQIAQQQVQAYWALSWYDSLLGIVERVFTIPFHMMASVLVLQVFTRRPGHQQLGWLGLAIAMHTMVNTTAVFLAGQLSVYVVEAILGGLAVIDIIIIIALRQPEPQPPGSADSQVHKTIPVFSSEPIEETTENLEKTRYQ